jgi:hypothetical protein
MVKVNYGTDSNNAHERHRHRSEVSMGANIEIEHAFEVKEHEPSHAIRSVNSSATIIEN